MMAQLTSIEQKQIEFHGDRITAVLVQEADGRENVYVPLRPLVEGIGLRWQAQYNRIRRNPILSNACTSVSVMDTQQRRRMLCIRISYLNGFLFGINVDRVKPEIRPLLAAYQEKCYSILFNAFNGTTSMRRFYQAIGHDDSWIEKRLEKHASGTDLNDIWLKGGIPIEHHDRLHDIINNGAFGLTIDQHKALKNIPQDANLYDNMTRIELLVALFGDETTRELAGKEEPATVEEHEQIAQAGGDIAGDIRKLYESRMGRPVLSDKNHLDKKRPSLNDGE